MGRLLEVYEEMQKTAEAKKAEQNRVDLLTKYASVSEELLEKEYGEDYTAEDVEKLAEALIEMDIQKAEELEKVAELEESGRIIARAFLEELKNESKS
jgi:hypothetical protein